MRTIRTKVYTFNELNKEAQETAINTNREINVCYSWWDFTYDDAKEIGLKITEFNLDRNKYIKGNFIQYAKYCAEKIKETHGETCNTYSLAEEFLAGYDNILNEEEDNQEIEEIENEFLSKLLEEYIDMLQNEYDYLQSDEAIKETFISNEYEFLSNGKVY